MLAVLLVSTLFLASIAPVAFAQGTDGEGRDGNVTIVDCSQVQNLFVQGQYGNANASAQYQSDAIALISQELNISQDQVNLCLVNVGGDGDSGGGGGDDDEEEAGAEDDEEAGAEEAAGVEAAETDDEGDVIASTVPEVEELPETGGASLLALGAGLVMVAGGVSLIRFRR